MKHATVRKAVAASAAMTLAVSLVLVASGAPARADLRPAAAGASRAQADYALDTFGDPWDFSNPEDFEVTPGVQSEGVHNLSMTGGVLHGDVDGFGKFMFIRSWSGLGLPWGRDPVLNPVDTNRYTTISFSMASDRAATGVVLWYTCAQILSSCQGGFTFPTKAGWNAYSFNIPSQQLVAGSLPWAGPILGLHIVPSAGGPASVSFDWVRLAPTGAAAAPSVPGPPQPRFLSPSRSGGTDYATAVRGDAWDFNESTDVAGASGVSLAVGGGVLNATNTDGDPAIELPLGPSPVDGTRYHRLVFGITYDGPFGLSGDPGGGMVARLIWQFAGHPEFFQDSQDIVVYPGTHVYEVDLATNPPSDATDEGNNPRIGGINQFISSVRFDPNEDPGPRHVGLDFVRLAADNDNTTPIQFFDAAWKAGETVDLYAAPNRDSCTGTAIATGVPVGQAVNQVAWPAGFPEGSYWVCGRFHDPTYESPVFASAVTKVGPTQHPFGYTAACHGASTAPGAFADAGLAADCLKVYGVSLGKADGTFGENDPLLRSQVSSLLARFLQLTGVTLSAARSFPDVNPNTVPNDQVRTEIEQLAGSGIIAGFPDGTFGPATHLSVAQAATLVVRTMAVIRMHAPAAPPIQDQGNTSSNYLYAVFKGILDRNAADNAGTRYANQPGDTTARGLLADMLAQSLQQ